MRLFLLFSLILGLGLAPAGAAEGPLGPGVRQLLVSIAPGWDASTGKMIGLERGRDGRWKAAWGPVPVLFGRNGLAWGRGVLGQGERGAAKAEKDGRAPAGVFRLGKIYTYDQALPRGADYPFHTVTEVDAWVDNPSLPHYNQHVVVDPKNPPPWFESQKMRHNDFAYRWLIEIRHNADPPVAGLGSAIFFHIRRGVTRPTAGCTTMAEKDIVSLMRWLDAGENPHYALLPWAEYQKKWEAWGLPNPAALAKIAP